MTTPTIERFEWDFDSCPEEQLELCFEYERARSSAGQQEIKDAESWRRRGIKWANEEDRRACGREGFGKAVWFVREKGATFDDHWQQIAAENCPMTAIALFPEFPATPFLKILADERSRRFAMIASVGIEPVASHDERLSKDFRKKHGGEDWTWVEQDFGDLQSYFGIDVRKSEGVSRKGFSYEIAGNAIKCPDMGATFGLFRFDWSCSDQTFIDALRAWLDKNRAQRVKIRDERGGGSEIRQFRSKLKQLGAWRLLNFPMKWSDAETHTANVRGQDNFLYQGQPSWIHARNAADKFLGMLAR